MRSIRARVTFLTVCAIVVSTAVVMAIGVFATRSIVRKDADNALVLLCETGGKNLNQYFSSVQQSAATIASLVESDLEDIDVSELGDHVDRMRPIFSQMALRTQGIRTYYYRIDPTVSSEDKGFWYVNEGRDGFREREATDISGQDLDDTSKLVWFTVPRATGESVWLPPYITDNLEARVISYDVPVYKGETFVGVVGIEIDYDTVARQVDNITLNDTGYAFLTDKQNGIIYHPNVDVTELESVNALQAPAGLFDGGTCATYTYEGVKKRAAHKSLSNGMKLVVCTTYDEIDGGWQRLARIIMLTALGFVLFFGFLAMRLANHITKPLHELTEVAGRVNAGDYDVELRHVGDDEVGVLSRAFGNLIAHLRVYVGDLSKLAYADALTSVSNKGAFDMRMRELDDKIAGDDKPAFALGMFDCDGLKLINDIYGHEKGDAYLQASCALIGHVFKNSPVYRVGGDEFAVVLEGEDFDHAAELVDKFERACARTCEENDEQWARLSVSAGIVTFDVTSDKSAADVLRRADELMYANKRTRKRARQNAE